VRQSPASKDMNVATEETTSLEAVAKQPMKTHKTEILVRVVMNCRLCELEIAL
jgi:hypothetical protein